MLDSSVRVSRRVQVSHYESVLMRCVILLAFDSSRLKAKIISRSSKYDSTIGEEGRSTHFLGRAYVILNG